MKKADMLFYMSTFSLLVQQSADLFGLFSQMVIIKSVMRSFMKRKYTPYAIAI